MVSALDWTPERAGLRIERSGFELWPGSQRFVQLGKTLDSQ